MKAIKFLTKTALGVCLVLILCIFGFSQDTNLGTGNLIGFVYYQDGVTPIVGAVVKVKDVSTGLISESIKSDGNGMFTLENLSTGVYSLGVVTAQGDFNLEELIGIKAGETTTVSFSLAPYSAEEAAAVQEIYSNLYQEEVIKGEVLVGRVLSYNRINETAEIFIIKGYLKLQDRIHIRGARSHFYQNVEDLVFGDQRVDKIFAGNNVMMTMKYLVEVGDLVYLVCKKGVVPFFLTPLGYITALAATGLITYGIVTVTEEPCPECSEFTPTTAAKKK
ncbi:carboxypeptidase-like regulatory domain-containing protein [Acidobacteriota bacterium]